MNNLSQKKDKIITVVKTNESFDHWIEKPYITEELKKDLKKANMLIVPMENFRNSSEPVFMVGTADLLDFIKENKVDDLIPEICIEDDDYKELRLHSIEVVLGTFVVTALLAPVLADLISEYLKRKIFKDQPIEDGNVQCEISVIESDGSSRQIKYDGPAKSFNTLMKNTMNSKEID